MLAKIRALNELAQQRGATLAQFATLWLLRRPEITTVLIGASKVAQIEDIHAGLKLAPLSAEEQAKVEQVLKS
ncbi:MAG: aldo/keto reductase [Lacunisphaera sp.]